VRCDFVDSLLHSYFDGELSSLDAVEFERHIKQCAECGTELAELDWLSARLQLAQLYVPAPASLLREIRNKLSPDTPTRAASQPLLWQWLAAAAAVLILTIVVGRVSPELSKDDYQSELAGEIVEAHMRSLQAGYTMGITSHDELAVSEWVDSKLKFAPPVRDFAGNGFALQGGRVDIIDGRAIVALVYEHQGQLIDVFIWPARKPDSAPREGSRQGFQWDDWRKGKMEFCAVSDVDHTALEQLHRLLDSSAS
jgi:anti-sigma factor RsiW